MSNKSNYVFCVFATISSSLFPSSTSIAGLFDWHSPESYEDCILANLKGSESDIVVKTLKNACAKKFPPNFDFDEVAKKSGVKTWSEVAMRLALDYQAATPAEKAEFKAYYFSKHIEPSYNRDFRDEAWDKFVTFANSKDSQIDNSLVVRASNKLFISVLTACREKSVDQLYSVSSETLRSKRSPQEFERRFAEMCKFEDDLKRLAESSRVELESYRLCVATDELIGDTGESTACIRIAVKDGELRLDE